MNISELSEFEVLNFRHVKHELDGSVVRFRTKGSSPEITNHLSDIIFKVAKGSGNLAVYGNIVVNLDASHPGYLISHGTPYNYESQSHGLDVEVLTYPILHSDFVTLDKETLSAEQLELIEQIWVSDGLQIGVSSLDCISLELLSSYIKTHPTPAIAQ